MARYRIEYREPDGRLLFDADDLPVPRPGDSITFPSGRTVCVADRPVEHSPAVDAWSLSLVVLYVEEPDG